MDDAEGARLRAARIEAGLGLDTLARITGLSKSHLSRVERGIRPVTPAMALAYQRALGWSLPPAAVTWNQSLGPAHDNNDEAEMRRRTLLCGFVAATTGIASHTPVADTLADVVSLTSTPAGIGEADADELEQAALSLTTRDLRGGGHAVIAEGRSLLEWGITLTEQARSAPLRQRFAAAAGYLADRTGWAAFDLGYHDQARKLFGIGIRLADEADDHNLTAQILSDMAGHAVFRGKPSEALDCAALALTSSRVTGQLKAALLGVTAEAYGQLGDLRQALHYIDQACEHADNATAPEVGPAWLPAFRGPQTLMASTGFAAYLAFGHGQDRSAATVALDHLATAAASLGSGRGRSVALCRLRQATITCLAGDTDEGLTLADEAVHGIPLARSTRIRRELRTLQTALPPAPTRTTARIDQLLTGHAPPPA